MLSKKFFILLLVSFLTISLSSCRLPEMYDFLHETDEISSISIVSACSNTQGEILEEELAIVDDIPGFIEEFQAVDCYINWGDPRGFSEERQEATVIKITYQNGDYELIGRTGQSEYTQASGLCYYAGFSVFEENAFCDLIEKYLPE